MFYTNQVTYMVKMIDDIVDANRFAPFHHEGDVRDSHDAALSGQLSNGVVGGGPGSVRIEGSTIAVRQNDRLLGYLDGIQLGLVARMTQIDRHADTFHPIDDFSAILTHSAVKWLERPVRDTSSEVIAQLRNAQPISKTAIHIIEVLELIAALQTKENTELAL